MSDAGLDLRKNVPLAPLTTLGVGGPARFFVTARTASEVEEAVAFAHRKNMGLFVLGGGSNLVISDRGFDGLVLHNAIGGISESEASGQGTFEVGAGVNWDDFVKLSIARGFGGVECLSGVPGSVGGTPVQNVGAYGQEVSQTIASVLAYDLGENSVRELQNSECGFAYRASIFNTTHRGWFIILRVTYQLHPGAEPELRYADLQNYFAAQSTHKPSLQQVREAVLKIRSSKGMLISPGDPDSHSAGSFFKNPVLSATEFEAVKQRAATRGLKVPSYPALAQQNKVSAAWLVENSGFHKGYARGRVGISSKHALAIVNRGGASAGDVIALRDEIQDKVEQTWDVRLQPEPVFVGF